MKLTKQKNYLKKNRIKFFDFESEVYSNEKKRHLKNIAYPNGKFQILPIDQGLEHGPSDFLENPPCQDPEYQLELAKEVGFSGIALQIGLAEKYWQKSKYKKYVPLILKLNGRTCIPAGQVAPFSSLNARVEDAVKLGADAVGYTLYVGSRRQDEDFIQFREVRRKAAKYDLPVIVWAYPRGEVIDANGGKNSLAAVDYAVRTAMELGADIVKFNWPTYPDEPYDDAGCFKVYNNLPKLSEKEMLVKVLQSAGEMGTLLSGGGRVSDKQVLDNIKLAMEVGMDGIIFGRNVWQREYEQAVKISQSIKKILLNS